MSEQEEYSSKDKIIFENSPIKSQNLKKGDCDFFHNYLGFYSTQTISRHAIHWEKKNTSVNFDIKIYLFRRKYKNLCQMFNARMEAKP